ncbi:uncharacterized protein LOC141647265 [Silene latifolia]|uniref:uncharacterized protein LOC141647265 n=1 Tax=Silene latifolia TaxID=37657 RepID=UPI003D77433A
MEDFKQLSAESIPQFQEGIALTLSLWDALDAGISNGFGTINQVNDFAARIFNFFHQINRKEHIYIDDLEVLLFDGLISFGIEAQDGSIEEVAEDLMIMHQECLEGQYQSIQKLRELKAVPRPVRQVINDSDEDEDDENTENGEASDMMVDSAPLQKKESSSRQMVDEDGWVTVPSRKNRGRN